MKTSQKFTHNLLKDERILLYNIEKKKRKKRSKRMQMDSISTRTLTRECWCRQVKRELHASCIFQIKFILGTRISCSQNSYKCKEIYFQMYNSENITRMSSFYARKYAMLLRYLNIYHFTLFIRNTYN